MKIKKFKVKIFFQGQKLALWSNCAANFQKVPKYAVGVKRLRTTSLYQECQTFFIMSQIINLVKVGRPNYKFS